MRYMNIRLLAVAMLLCLLAALAPAASAQPADPTVGITPNPMYVYYAHAIDPMVGQITIGSFSNGHTLGDINLTSLHVNDSIVPLSAVIVDNGGVPELHVDLYIKGFIEGYGLLWDSNDLPFSVSGFFADGAPFAAGGIVTIIGRLSGDANNDNVVDIADASFLVSYIFSHGSAPRPLQAGDANCDGSINIADVAYLIKYVFADGMKPCVLK
jgi:hypothetical protein